MFTVNSEDKTGYDKKSKMQHIHIYHFKINILIEGFVRKLAFRLQQLN